MRAHFMTRHLDKDVRKQMHYPVYDLIHVNETAAIKQALEAERLLDIDPETFETGGFDIDGAISTARRMMGEAMAPQVADYVKVLLGGGEAKLVVFCWHHSVMAFLAKQLERYGTVQISGSDSGVAKERKKNDFIKRSDIRVLIGNLQSVGVGVDGLQDVCWHGLIAEPSWVPGDNVQAFKRLDRMGQTQQVLGEIFVAPGSIAEQILGTALRKGLTLHKALDRKPSELV
jgi:SNF2 family DNA or RNA helicase